MTTSLEARLRRIEYEVAAEAARPPLDESTRVARVTQLVAIADPNLHTNTRNNRRACRVAELMALAQGREHAAEFNNLA